MVLGFLKSNYAPIAIDFGYSQLKLLQLTNDEPSKISSAACAEIPESIRPDHTARQEYLAKTLPGLLSKGRFKGKLAVCSIPSWQTFVQHMRFGKSDGADKDTAIMNQLQSVIACDPDNVVVRHFDVGTIHSGQSVLNEVICFAIGREIVMNYVDLLRKCKLVVGGMHAEPIAMLYAFWHLYRRENDDLITTMYIDIGGGSTKAMITHGRDLKFTRSIPIGGRHFDKDVADKLHCDIHSAHAHRMSAISHTRPDAKVSSKTYNELNKSGALLANSVCIQSLSNTETDTGILKSHIDDGNPDFSTNSRTDQNERRSGILPAEFSKVTNESQLEFHPNNQNHNQSLVYDALSDLYEQLIEEIRMCSRYHVSTYPDRPIHRLVITGGESTDSCLSHNVAKQIGMPAFIGDPVKRLQISDNATLLDFCAEDSNPQWTVAAGLCKCPIEE